MTASTSVHAAPPRAAEAAARLEASAFDRFAVEEYEAGIAALERAYELVKDPEFLLNLAVAEDQRGGRCAEALSAFERYFRACDGAAARDGCGRLAIARQRHTLIARRCSTGVRVVTAPAGASVRIDGFPRGSSPLVARVPPGDHIVSATVANHLPAEARLSLRSGDDALVRLDLAPAPSDTAMLTFVHAPEDAEVRFDGAAPRPARAGPIALGPGQHDVAVAIGARELRLPAIDGSRGADVLILVDKTPPEPPPGPGLARILGLAGVGVGTVGTIAGTALAAAALAAIDEREAARTAATPSLDEIRANEASAQDLSVAASVTLGAGIAALATGGALLVWDLWTAPGGAEEERR